MQAELNSDVALSAANALISHLRRNPGAAMTPARELAQTFGLDEAFVAQVLQGINANRRPEAKPLPNKGPERISVGQRLSRLWERMTARPVLFVIVTFLLSVAAIYGLSKLAAATGAAQLHRGSGEATFSSQSLIFALSIVGVVGLTFLLHMAVYFHHRKARYALWGGLFLFLMMVTFLGVSFAMGNRSIRTSGAPNPAFLFLVGAMGLLMVSLMYVGVGSLCAVLGGWLRFKMQERAEESMSRQDLLERYFELQSRLQKSVYPRATTYEPPLFSTPIVEWYRRNQFLTNAIIGFALGTIASLALRAAGIRPGDPNTSLNAWFFVLMLVSITEFVFFIVQGYLSKTAWRAALGGFCVAVGSLLSRFIPIPGADMRDGNGPTGEVLAVLLNIGISCAGYLGAVVQNRAIKESNLQRNDQATLLAEMVRLQWKLSNEAAAVCVMVIDAAKSSEMKASANPLAVEYTFRQYQEWIEQISAERGGKVHSTAGDGAVVAFTTCGLALSAARKLQTDVFRFNKDLNRLQHPFRLRVGLHTGEIIGDIDEVQFTEVIDIAAHIESACPVGGIAATDDVVAKLPDEQFIDLSVIVDGHQVFMVANATEYQ